MNKYLETVVACPLTSKLHTQWMTLLQIKCLNKKAEIAVDQIRTIRKQRLKNKIDTLSNIKAAQLRKLITDMYGE
jgi:mRNA interferase MazF